MTKLTSLEWTLIWSSLRYFIGRRTIAAATYPGDIIAAYYHRLSPDQKKELAREIAEHQQRGGELGDAAIDAPHWLKFEAALDSSAHQQVELTDGKRVTVFRANGRCYPLKEYLTSPQMEIFMPDEHVRALVAEG